MTMRTTTAFLAGRHRLVMAVLALALAVGGLGVTGELAPDWVTAVAVDGGSVGNRTP
jgi:hypothetical protein